MASKNAGLPIKVEFGGGLELLFSNERKHSVTLPATYDPAQVDAYETGGVPREGNSEADMRFLIWYLRHQVLADKSRPELFTQRDTVRPGVLVLINSADWELEGELEYALQPNDEVLFISTLHGG